LLENLPSFLVAFNVCALSFPRFAAAAGATWAIGRVMYQLGYGKKGPKGRGVGSIFGSLSALTLVSYFVNEIANCSSVEQFMDWLLSTSLSLDPDQVERLEGRVFTEV
jgi:hypothetical protein